jgi:hypothetical protein
MMQEDSQKSVTDAAGYIPADYRFAALMELPDDPDMLRLSRNLRRKRDLSDTARYRLDKHIRQALIGRFPVIRDEVGIDAA